MPPLRRRVWRENSPFGRRPELIQYLCAWSHEAARADGLLAEQLATIAVELAEDPGAQLLPALAGDLLAECLAHRANALRVLERYREAEALWRRAENEQAGGTGDLLLAANLAFLKTSYLRDIRRLTEAAEAGQFALETFDSLGETHRAFLATLKLTTVLYARGDLDSAFVNLVQAGRGNLPSELLESYGSLLHHKVTLYLTELGDSRAVLALLALAAPAFEKAPISLQLQRRWVEGKALANRRQWGDAANVYRALRLEYLTRERPFDAALVGLDLLLCLAESGRFAAVGELATEVLEVFERLDLPGETAKAVRTLMLAAERARADLELVRRVHGLLQPLRRLPPSA